MVVSTTNSIQAPTSISSSSIDINILDLFRNQERFCRELSKGLAHTEREFNRTVQVIQRDAAQGISHIFFRLFGHPMRVSGQLGMIANLGAFAGLIARNPHIGTIGLLCSSVAHLLTLEEGQSREALVRALNELTIAKDDLERINGSLRAEIEQIQQILIELKEEGVKLRENNRDLQAENRTLQANNEELRLSIISLQSTIRRLEDNINTLQRFNISFSRSFQELSRSLRDIRESRVNSEEKQQRLAILERSLRGIKDEFKQYTICFQQTQRTLQGHRTLISTQILQINEILQDLNRKIPDIGKIHELELVQRQLELAIAGMRQYENQLKFAENDLKNVEEKCAEQYKNLVKSKGSCRSMLHSIQMINAESTINTQIVVNS